MASLSKPTNVSSSLWKGCIPEITLGSMMVDGKWEPGFLCMGVPIGSDPYVLAKMEKKLTELQEEVSRASSVLGEEKRSLWTVLRSSTLHKLDYWLGLVHPRLM